MRIAANPQTTDSKKGSLSKTNISKTSSEISSSIDLDHFVLFNSSLPVPDEPVCKQAQKRALSGIDADQIKTVQTLIHGDHWLMEDEILNKSMLAELKSSSSQYWEKWEHIGTIQYPGGEKFENKTDGATIIANLGKVNNLIKDSALQTDLRNMQDTVNQAVKNHDVSQFVKLHAMLHDFDYWVINYPAYFHKINPPDWGGGNCYYGILSGI
jgi:hypothetical protein